MKLNIKASELLDLLAARHSGDVFIPECKNGPTHGGHDRLDAWAMRKSWSTPTTFGYEIKVSRSDFLNDEKWRKYLGYCSSFSFVCPDKLIAREEVPPEAGLIYASVNGKRLVTKKAAPLREVAIPEDLFRYILMWRANIQDEYKPDTVEEWKKRIRDRRFRKRMGDFVAGKVGDHIRRVEEENASLRNRIASYENVKKKLVAMGIPLDEHDSDWKLVSALDKLLGAIPKDFEWAMDSVVRGIDGLRGRIAELKGNKNVA